MTVQNLKLGWVGKSRGDWSSGSGSSGHQSAVEQPTHQACPATRGLLRAQRILFSTPAPCKSWREWQAPRCWWCWCWWVPSCRWWWWRWWWCAAWARSALAGQLLSQLGPASAGSHPVMQLIINLPSFPSHSFNSICQQPFVERRISVTWRKRTRGLCPPPKIYHKFAKIGETCS